MVRWVSTSSPTHGNRKTHHNNLAPLVDTRSKWRHIHPRPGPPPFPDGRGAEPSKRAPSAEDERYSGIRGTISPLPAANSPRRSNATGRSPRAPTARSTARSAPSSRSGTRPAPTGCLPPLRGVLCTVAPRRLVCCGFIASLTPRGRRTRAETTTEAGTEMTATGLGDVGRRRVSPAPRPTGMPRLGGHGLGYRALLCRPTECRVTMGRRARFSKRISRRGRRQATHGPGCRMTGSRRVSWPKQLSSVRPSPRPLPPYPSESAPAYLAPS